MAHAIPRGGVTSSPVPSEACLGRTCLQWRADGELAEPDVALVLARLRAADPLLEAQLAEIDAAA